MAPPIEPYVTAMRRSVLATFTTLALVACGGAARQPPPVIADVIASPASAFTRITVTARHTAVSAVVPAALLSLAAPLLAAKTIPPADLEPLSEYGLDDPVATITYAAPGSSIVLSVGGPDFDAHGFYVDRPGDRDVYLVLSANVRPLLMLVGIATPAPGPD
jgi:hypothetical protein